MDKAQIITLWYLLVNNVHDTAELTSISDYVNQFNVIEENVRSVLDNAEDL